MINSQRPSSVVTRFALLLLAVSVARSSSADIYQWEYVNPSDPSQGKQQSSIVCAGGAGVDAVPGVSLYGRDLTMAYLIGKNLTGASVTQAMLSQADLTGADVRGTYLNSTTDKGFTAAQLYSTASYQAHDLTYIGLESNNLAGWNFAGQNLSNASFYSALLTGADFTNANVTRTYLKNATSNGFTAPQLYSTASYQTHDLTGIILDSDNLSGWNFTGQNLTNANLNSVVLSGANLSQANLTNVSLRAATLSGADFTNATVTDADFASTTSIGFTAAQLYSTASYQTHDLTNVIFSYDDISGWNLAGQNLAGANFSDASAIATNYNLANLRFAHFVGAKLNNANLREANLTSAWLQSAILTGADFTGAQVQKANLREVTATGFTAAQFYSTATYQSQDLAGIQLIHNSMAGWNFFAQNLTGADLDSSGLSNANFNSSNLTSANLSFSTLSTANFSKANLTGADLDYTTLNGANFKDANLVNTHFEHVTTFTGADFTNANITGATFWVTNFAATQLYSTASYQSHDLTGVTLQSNNLNGWNFAGQNLTGVNFQAATLTGADYTNAIVTKANFTSTTSKGFTAAQLYSSASYQVHNLTEIRLDVNDVSGWNFADQNLTGASFYSATLAGTDLTNAIVTKAIFASTTPKGFTPSQLYATANYQSHDLTGIGLYSNDLSGWNFVGQNLTSANFNGSTLTNTDFTNAIVAKASFSSTTSKGFTAAQLYATASYQSGNVPVVVLSSNNLNGWNFANLNLTGSSFFSATVVGTDFTAADTRGASSLTDSQLATAVTVNLIRPNGTVNGLDLGLGQSLQIRDYDGERFLSFIGSPVPIKIAQHFAMDAGSALRMLLEADAWDSTISFAAGIPVTLGGGTLDLQFALGVDPSGQLGRTFRLFNWSGVSPNGTFNIVSPYSWDLSRLYTNGEVTLIPEPATVALVAFGCCARTWTLRRRRLCRWR
jgi:uncharacterized protein YjbI with pentapeptide repeats